MVVALTTLFSFNVCQAQGPYGEVNFIKTLPNMGESFLIDMKTSKKLANGYRWNKENFEAGIDIPASAESRADVGVITTLDDMIKWSLALNDNRLLNPESIKFMFSPGTLKTGMPVPYGYGWYIYFFRDQLIYEHGGAFRTGFNSRISRFPKSGIEIIILSNIRMGPENV